MDKNPYKRIAVWMDHSKAYIIGYRKGVARLIETVDSPFERIKRQEGEGSDHTRFGSDPSYSSINENRKNNISKNELDEYFKILENKLTGYEELLILGPGTAKAQFKNRLTKSKSFSVNRLSLKDCDRLTGNQLLAYIQEFYKD
jgi:hypothetical protein